MNIELVTDSDKALFYEYEALIDRCIKNSELGPDTLVMQNRLSPKLKYYGMELGCLCNANGWLKSLRYLSAVIKELHNLDSIKNIKPVKEVSDGKYRERKTKKKK